MHTVQSRKHKNNMIGQTNPTDHKKPVNRKKRTVTGKLNKVRVEPNLEKNSIDIVLNGADNAGITDRVIRRYKTMKAACRFFKKGNQVRTKNV